MELTPQNWFYIVSAISAILALGIYLLIRKQ
jgi:hypothetical protein